MKIKTENARFTFLTESLVRIEYSPMRIFNDGETLFATNRSEGTKNVHFSNSGNRYEFVTKYFRLTYINDNDHFSPCMRTYKVKNGITANKMKTTWGGRLQHWTGCQVI